MNREENVYHVEKKLSLNSLKFFFISHGERNLVKAIHYSFVLPFDGKDVFNLGFGDYDVATDTIMDQADTNNGDVYKVFNTVLSTIPVFFENYAKAYLMVAGSNSSSDFIENCRPGCKKGCIDGCRKYNRRIAIYRNYVDKNFDLLKADYEFLGGIRNANQQIVIEPYIKFKKYYSVFLSKKV